jgi:predicted DNA-binding transcriptional regulator AlpA
MNPPTRDVLMCALERENKSSPVISTGCKRMSSELFEVEDDAFENDRLLNRQQLKHLLPVSSMTIWRFERDGKLPKHRNIGRKAFWRATEVREYLRGRK